MMPQLKTIETARILIVDDRVENRLLLASQLRTSGDYEILQAADGVEGLAAARAEDPDLILLDVMMPRIGGFEMCRELKNDPATSSIPIIMVTTLREMKYKLEGIESGADEFLSRPHHREELLIRVRSLIQLKRAREKLEEERNRLQLLYDVSRATTAQLDLEEVMAQIITHMQAAVGAHKGTIILLDEAEQLLHKVTVRQGSFAEVSPHNSDEIISDGWAGWLLRQTEIDIIDDVTQDSRWVMLPGDIASKGSALGTPLARADRNVGVMILTHADVGYFNSVQLSLVATIAAQLTAVIENAYLFKAVNEQRRQLQTIYAHSNDAIISTDKAQIITLCNQAACRLFSLSADRVVGRAVRDVPQLQVLDGLFQRAGLEAVSQEVTAGGQKTFIASVSPIPDVGFMAILQDISEIKRAEELRLMQERRQRELVKETFARYIGPKLVDHVLADEPSLLARRERRTAVVLFADLRGFTRLIVNLEPNTAIKILNQFFSSLTDIVYEFEGTIFDLAGDELMVGFNVPFDQEDAVRRAVQTALTMQNHFNELRQQWYAELSLALGLGIGIDQGPVVVGNVGAESRMNFAMVGEAVNTAHRLVDMASDGQIVISAAIHQEIADGQIPAGSFKRIESLGTVSLKGKSTPEKLYRILIERSTLIHETD